MKIISLGNGSRMRLLACTEPGILRTATAIIFLD